MLLVIRFVAALTLHKQECRFQLESSQSDGVLAGGTRTSWALAQVVLSR